METSTVLLIFSMQSCNFGNKLCNYGKLFNVRLVFGPAGRNNDLDIFRSTYSLFEADHVQGVYALCQNVNVPWFLAQICCRPCCHFHFLINPASKTQHLCQVSRPNIITIHRHGNINICPKNQRSSGIQLTSLRQRFWYLRSLNLIMSSNFIGPISCLFSQQVWSWEHESEFAGLWRREAGWWKGGRAGCNGGEVLVRVQPHTLIWKNHGKVGFDKYSENENISFCCFRKHGFLHDFDLEMQDSNAWQRRSGVDVLSFEARNECSWVRLWGVNHLLQVSFHVGVPSFSFPSQFVRSWTSMEHDRNWEPKVFSFQVGRKSCWRLKTPWRCYPGGIRLRITLSKLTCRHNFLRVLKKNTGT